MDAIRATNATRHITTTDRESDRELVIRRTFDGPARLVFKAWTTAELMQRWWVPESFGINLVSCAVDARIGGGYRFEFAVPGSDQPFAFFGKYLDVQPHSRLVWTNEESPDGAVSTLTLVGQDGKTLLTLTDQYPSKEALDEAIASGSTGAHAEQFDNLDAVLGEMD